MPFLCNGILLIQCNLPLVLPVLILNLKHPQHTPHHHHPCTTPCTHAPTHARPSLPVNQNPKPIGIGYTLYCSYIFIFSLMIWPNGIEFSAFCFLLFCLPVLALRPCLLFYHRLGMELGFFYYPSSSGIASCAGTNRTVMWCLHLTRPCCVALGGFWSGLWVWIRFKSFVNWVSSFPSRGCLLEVPSILCLVSIWINY